MKSATNEVEETGNSLLKCLHLAAYVLWKICENKTNVCYMLHDAETLKSLTAILQLQIQEIDKPVLGLLNQCCSDVSKIISKSCRTIEIQYFIRENIISSSLVKLLCFIGIVLQRCFKGWTDLSLR